jgi:hypothetical protein
MPAFKLSPSSILADGNPRILLSHFVLGVVHAVKVYGQYGEVSKHYDMACQVINYGLGVNKFVVSHRKLGGQHLQVAQKECCRTGLSPCVRIMAVIILTGIIKEMV